MNQNTLFSMYVLRSVLQSYLLKINLLNTQIKRDIPPVRSSKSASLNKHSLHVIIIVSYLIITKYSTFHSTYTARCTRIELYPYSSANCTHEESDAVVAKRLAGLLDFE